MLKGLYKTERDEIGRTLIDFLNGAAVENQEMMCEALSLFSDIPLDFVDCILIARQRGLGDEGAGFDKKLNKMLSQKCGKRRFVSYMQGAFLCGKSGWGEVFSCIRPETRPPALKGIDLFLVKGFSVLCWCHALKLPEQFHEMLFIGESAHGGNLPDGQGMTVQQIF